MPRPVSRSAWLVPVVAGLLFPLNVAAAENDGAGVRSHAAAVLSITSRELQRHAALLADDTFEGREAGTRGGLAAARYLLGQLRQLDVAPAGVDGGYFQPFDTGYRNLLVRLEGSDPKLKREIIMMGAHYDHVGYGTRRNSYGPIGYIHNGADDNASGSAGLLEIIEAFASYGARPKRTLLFAFWDAEEKGLLGSKHWTGQPTVPLSRVRFMINLDMIGRLGERVEVYGSRTAPGLRRLVSEHNRDIGLPLAFDWEIKENSDHHSFFDRGVPILMLHTGLHGDYHRPSDDAEKLNDEGMRQLTRLLFAVAEELANAPEVPGFRPGAASETQSLQQRWSRPQPLPPPRLGLHWEPADEFPAGLRVTRVAPGSAAERAGLQPGDRILQFNDARPADTEEFKAWVLASPAAASLTVARAGERQPRRIDVRLGGAPVRIGVAWRMDDAEPGCAALSRVVPGSPAGRAGLKADDRIYAVEDEEFRTSEELLERLLTVPSPVQLTVERNGQIRDVQLQLVKPPENNGPLGADD